MKLFLLLAAFFVSCIVTPIHAETVELLNGTENISISKFIFTHEQEQVGAQTSKTDQLSRFLASEKTRKASEGLPNFGYDRGVLFAKFEIKNQSSKSEWILRLGNPHLKNVSLYKLENSTPIEVIRTGIDLPLASRPFLFRDFWLPIQLESGKSATFILSAESGQWLSIVPHISSREFAEQLKDREWAIQLFGLGGMLFVLLYNLFVYFVTRERVYLLYILASIAVNLLVFPGCSGLHVYLFPNHPILAQEIWHASAIGWITFTALFARDFLFKADYEHPISRILKYSALCAAPLTALPFLIGPNHEVAVFFNIVSGLFQFILLLACWRSAFVKKYTPAFIFLLAWGFPIVSGAVFLAATQGFFPVTDVILYTLTASSVWEVIVMATALGYRIVVLQKEQNRVQLQLMEKAKLEGELQAAQAVQEQLLPLSGNLPGIHISTYFQPAETAGGDWYGYIHHEEQNRVTFYIGDITGHGITSAVLTGVVCGAVYAAEKRSKQLGHVTNMQEQLQMAAESLDSILFETAARTGHMMTMCFLSIDLSTGEACSLNAGHTWPIFARRNGDAISCEKLPGGGSLLGSGSQSYGIHSFSLNQGDTILLYTDGLVENESKNGEVLNYRRLRTILSTNGTLAEQMQSLEQTIAKLWAGVKLSDDVTFLGVRFGHP